MGNLRLLLGMGVLVAAVSASAQTTYDLATGFSFTSNPNGPVSYGSKTGFTAGYSNLTTSINSGGFKGWGETSSLTGTSIVKNTSGATATIGSGSFAAGSLVLLPGTNVSTLRFTAPTAGVYTLTGSFNYVSTQAAAAGDGATVSIRTFDGATVKTLLGTTNITTGSPTQTFSYTTSSLSSGAFIDLMAYGFQDKTGDAVRLTGSITTPVPEPATLSVFGVATLAFLRRRRKK